MDRSNQGMQHRVPLRVVGRLTGKWHFLYQHGLPLGRITASYIDRTENCFCFGFQMDITGFKAWLIQFLIKPAEMV